MRRGSCSAVPLVEGAAWDCPALCFVCAALIYLSEIFTLT